MDSTNAESLLNVANQYQIEPVKMMCAKFIFGQIDATNCLGNNRNTDLPLWISLSDSCSVLLQAFQYSQTA